MFDRMQYIIELPTTVHFRRMWQSQINDSGGNILGYVIRKDSAISTQIWFEDTNGTKLGEIRKEKGHRLSEFAIYDQMNELRGKIRCPMVVEITSVDVGSYTLDDPTGNRIAKSDEYSYELTLSSSARFDRLKGKGLNIRASDGSMMAIIHGVKSSQGCQIDIYPSNVNQLLVLSLVASIWFL